MKRIECLRAIYRDLESCIEVKILGAVAGARSAFVMVGIKVPGVRQLRNAEQVDLVRLDQG